MGEIKKRNRKLPYHSTFEMEADKITHTPFFEQILHQEVEKEVKKAIKGSKGRAKTA